MKSKYIFFLLISFFVFSCNVLAEQNLYKNKNGIELTKKEYNYLNKLFNEKFIENMNFDDYKLLIEGKNIENSIIETKNDRNSINPIGTIVSSSSKKLQIGKSCSSNHCTISIVVNWLVSPDVRSYDVIGSRFDGIINYVEFPRTKVITENSSYDFNEANYFSNGHGVSVKLPSNDNNITIYQYFIVNGSGTIYSSYQHSMDNISLNNSKKYTISWSGYGKVFNFDSSIKSYYDGMNGVDISF